MSERSKKKLFLPIFIINLKNNSSFIVFGFGLSATFKLKKLIFERMNLEKWKPDFLHLAIKKLLENKVSMMLQYFYFHRSLLMKSNRNLIHLIDAT